MEEVQAVVKKERDEEKMPWSLKPINPLSKILGKKIRVDFGSKNYNENLNFPEDFKKIRRKKKTILDEGYTEDEDNKSDYMWVPKGREGGKPAAKMPEVENVVNSPFLTEEEKRIQLDEMGATDSAIRIAKMRRKDNRRKYR